MTWQQKWTAFYTIFIKEVLRFLRIWKQTILPAVITTVLYFIIFGHLMGAAIGDMEGIPYHNFIAPGLVMMAVIGNAYGNTVASFFSAKFHGHIEEMLVSPTPNTIILLGFIGGGVARGMIVGAAVISVVLLFTDLPIYNPLITLSIVILTSILFSLAGIINGIYAQSFDDISIIPTFVLTPLTYLGGVFYSISMLPEFWQNISLFNPILYMVNGFRYGILGVSDIDLLHSYLITLGFISLLFFYTLYLLRMGKGLRS
jgi:ABC-2 type transport system permease protein